MDQSVSLACCVACMVYGPLSSRHDIDTSALSTCQLVRSTEIHLSANSRNGVRINIQKKTTFRRDRTEGGGTQAFKQYAYRLNVPQIKSSINIHRCNKNNVTFYLGTFAFCIKSTLLNTNPSISVALFIFYMHLFIYLSICFAYLFISLEYFTNCRLYIRLVPMICFVSFTSITSFDIFSI